MMVGYLRIKSYDADQWHKFSRNLQILCKSWNGGGRQFIMYLQPQHSLITLPDSLYKQTGNNYAWDFRTEMMIRVVTNVIGATYGFDDTRGCVMQFWPPDDEHMCSKHVEAWNKTCCKTKILCIKLVKYWDKYTKMHGQQNVKTFEQSHPRSS